MYKPLPDSLEIRDSEIHGQGVFAKQDIIAGHNLGITHLGLVGQYRTPLGGFLNHSDNPNCFIHDNEAQSFLYSVRPIGKEEELTVYYRKYNVWNYNNFLHNSHCGFISGYVFR